MDAEALRVVLADDHPLFLSGLRAMVQRADGVAWVGDADSGEKVLELLAAISCDVVLMDLRMPGMGGLEATRRLLETPDPPAVIVLTMVEDDESVFAALRAGARGYLLKGADEIEILAAVRLVSRGGVVMGPAVAVRLLHRLQQEQPAPDLPFPELTVQERRVLEVADRYEAIARAREGGLGR